MAKPNWPAKERRTLIGKRIERVDGPDKASGAAKYSFDINRPGMLWAKLHTSEHAHAVVKAIDTSPAEALKGVEAVWKDEALIGKEVLYEGQILAAVAAATEEIAEEAAELVKVAYEPQEHQVIDDDIKLVTGRPNTRETGDVEEAFKDADSVTEGEYGLPVITHCCLEPHGQVAEFRPDSGELHLWPSTQNVSRYTDRLSDAVDIPQNKMKVDCQYMGGGFGSKFSYDKWGVISTLLSKRAGKPVKLLLDRATELKVAGNRPSAYARIKVGAKRTGELTAFDIDGWGTGGTGRFNLRAVPYVFTKIPNTRLKSQGVRTNRGSQRAWRAPGHPQACLLTMSALEDAAAALKMDALEFFRKNLDLTDRPEVYGEELEIAADMIGYKQKAHLRGDAAPGTVKRGLGIAMHTWGGRGHSSECDVTVNPDGSVEAKIGTQDLGTGTRTTIGIVIADTLGLPLEAIDVHIGRNAYPPSGGSGGSTTIGGVSASSRLAATAVLDEIAKVAAPKLGVNPEELEAAGGKIRQAGKEDNAITWKEACALLGPNTVTKRGTNDRAKSEELGLISSGVGGVQMADVSVDTETGVVTINEMVAVQDCGLIIDLKTAESQVLGALIMGVTYALYEEALYDSVTGQMLNADMEFYRLAGIKDVGKLKVHMMTGQDYENRGVIGLGEPPAISPGAAISNAVANACGVRVPHLPLTPDRVVTAMEKGGII